MANIQHRKLLWRLPLLLALFGAFLGCTPVDRSATFYLVNSRRLARESKDTANKLGREVQQIKSANQAMEEQLLSTQATLLSVEQKAVRCERIAGVK